MPPPLAAGREVRSAALGLLVCLSVLADGFPAAKAACAQAMLQGVRD
jgi:hypothetical protein